MDIGNRRSSGASIQWYVMETKPRKETVVWRQLLGHKLEAFYPQLPVGVSRNGGRVFKPYFPRYLFVWADLEQMGLSRFQHIPHARGLVCVGDEPAPVAEPLVRAIQQRVRDVSAGGAVFGNLRRGDPVCISGGPFDGYEALFDAHLSGGERVRVLLQVLGRPSLAVLMSAAHILRAKQPRVAA
ncbi:MAG: transcription termination/antitermination protein NusG [Anaerolineales bacterium]